MNAEVYQEGSISNEIFERLKTLNLQYITSLYLQLLIAFYL